MQIRISVHSMFVQVSIGCVERGHLMADVWTSQSEMVTHIIRDVAGNDDAHTAMANALHRKQTVVEKACIGLKEKYDEVEERNAALQKHVAELQNALLKAEQAALGKS